MQQIYPAQLMRALLLRLGRLGTLFLVGLWLHAFLVVLLTVITFSHDYSPFASSDELKRSYGTADYCIADRPETEKSISCLPYEFASLQAINSRWAVPWVRESASVQSVF